MDLRRCLDMLRRAWPTQHWDLGGSPTAQRVRLVESPRICLRTNRCFLECGRIRDASCDVQKEGHACATRIVLRQVTVQGRDKTALRISHDEDLICPAWSLEHFSFQTTAFLPPGNTQLIVTRTKGPHPWKGYRKDLQCMAPQILDFCSFSFTLTCRYALDCIEIRKASRFKILPEVSPFVCNKETTTQTT